MYFTKYYLFFLHFSHKYQAKIIIPVCCKEKENKTTKKLVK